MPLNIRPPLSPTRLVAVPSPSWEGRGGGGGRNGTGHRPLQGAAGPVGGWAAWWGG